MRCPNSVSGDDRCPFHMATLCERCAHFQTPQCDCERCGIGYNLYKPTPLKYEEEGE
jgi:hypothetical protein